MHKSHTPKFFWRANHWKLTHPFMLAYAVIHSLQDGGTGGTGSFTDNDVETIIRDCGSCLGYTGLKSKQIEAITEFVKGKNTFVTLPMGYGKPLIYAVLATTCI